MPTQASAAQDVTKTPSIAFGIIELRVRDLTQTASFYKALIGLEEIGRTERVLVLGSSGQPLLRFHQDASARRAEAYEAGLYHIALLFSSQAYLAGALDRLVRAVPGQYQGSADHLVTEAFYFNDPDGNGVELYVDRPRTEWPVSNGRIVMGTEPLDTEQFIRRHFNPIVSGSVAIGHLHLKVGSIEAARTLFTEVLGFQVMMSLPNALFLSYDGYHHHIGVNTWESEGAGRPNDTRLGLISYTMYVQQHIYEKIIKRMKKDVQTKGLTITDPWGVTITLVSM